MSVSDPRRPVASIIALGGGLGSFAVDALYLAAIAQQGVAPPGGRFVFVALWIAAAGLLAAIGAFVHSPGSRATLLGLGAAMLVALAVPAVFSFWIPLMLCAALVGMAGLRAAALAPVPKWVGLLGPLAALAVAGLGVAVGFAITDF